MCRGTQRQESGDSWVWHLPVNPVLSTAVCTFSTLSKLVTSLLSAPLVSSQPPSLSEVNYPFWKEKEKPEVSSASSLLHHHQCNPWRKGSLGFKALLQIQREIEPGYCTIQGMHSQLRAGQTDRQTGVRPWKTHPFPPAHTGARAAPGSVPRAMQMGNGPHPLR